MARRRLYEEQYQGLETQKEHHSLVWWIFCMPGSLLMWLEYMFPGKGHVYATGRRYRNRVVQAMYTAAIYFVIIVGLLSLINSHPR